ncbi:F-box protein [Striga asiatica]|uniref:F-box protein n=1 Tax=Striga asiatica TaxID=4170 RepID=A0A5A7RAW1_STRAF|nr:F-box protein [Striga asiatica]
MDPKSKHWCLMGCKRVELDLKLQPKKYAERSRLDKNGNDWISRLPNDILIIILSLVPLKEAACTTILSSRFINLWKHIPSLNFYEDNLKHLEFYCLYHVKSIRISAPNLSVLIVDRLKVVRLENVPVFSEVSVICGMDSIECLFPTIACCISRLKMLTLELIGLEKNIDHCKFPELPMLKKLELIWFQDSQDPSWPCRNYKNYEIELPHEHLKWFESCGYHGRFLDVGFVRYIVENFVMLKNLVIDTSYLGWATRTCEVLEREKSCKELRKATA